MCSKFETIETKQSNFKWRGFIYPILIHLYTLRYTILSLYIHAIFDDHAHVNVYVSALTQIDFSCWFQTIINSWMTCLLISVGVDRYTIADNWKPHIALLTRLLLQTYPFKFNKLNFTFDKNIIFTIFFFFSVYVSLVIVSLIHNCLINVFAARVIMSLLTSFCIICTVVDRSAAI